VAIDRATRCTFVQIKANKRSASLRCAQALVQSTATLVPTLLALASPAGSATQHNSVSRDGEEHCKPMSAVRADRTLTTRAD